MLGKSLATSFLILKSLDIFSPRLSWVIGSTANIIFFINNDISSFFPWHVFTEIPTSRFIMYRYETYVFSFRRHMQSVSNTLAPPTYLIGLRLLFFLFFCTTVLVNSILTLKLCSVLFPPIIRLPIPTLYLYIILQNSGKTRLIWFTTADKRHF